MIMCFSLFSAFAEGAPAPMGQASPQAPSGGGSVGLGVGSSPAPHTGADVGTQIGTGGSVPLSPEGGAGSSSGLSDLAVDHVDIDQYFDEALRAAHNPIVDFFRRLPRYGMSFFRQPLSTYAPLDSVPVTPGYLLGPDDELAITLWGMPDEGSFNVMINRDGMAVIPHIGAVRLAGYSLEEAKRILKARFDQYFTDYQMNVSMGGLRSITVYVTGDAKRPGAYTVSSFSTLVNALLVSGGPSESGSLRHIELKRGSQTIQVFDMYDLLLKGDKSKDSRLLPGDVIFIPSVGPLVGVAGEIQRPGVYELKGKTRVQDLLSLAGGLSGQTFKGRIQYYKVEERTYRTVFEGDIAGLADTVLSNGDLLRLFPVVDVPTTVRIDGPVGRPGVYGVKPGVTRLSELISQAGGLLAIASDSAELTRVTPSLQGPVGQRIEIDLKAALKGDPANDLVLEFNDHLLVRVVPEWGTQRMVTVEGEVLRPGSYAMLKGERLSDLIARAGGFTSRASLKGAIFTRRSVAEEQRRALNQTADQMERDMLESQQNIAGGSDANSASYTEEQKRRKELIDRLRDVDIMGRVIVKLDVPKAIMGTPWDFELEDGDALRVPEVPLTINVMGAVYASSSHIYSPSMGINAYVNASGGALKSAHKRMLYLLKADGTVIRLMRNTGMLSGKQWTAPRGFSSVLEPGDTIVVPVKYTDRQSFDSLRDTVDIIYKLAVGVGVLIK